MMGWSVCVSVSLGALWSVWYLSASVDLFTARSEMVSVGLNEEGVAIPYHSRSSECALPSLLKVVHETPANFAIQGGVRLGDTVHSVTRRLSDLSIEDRLKINSSLSQGGAALATRDLISASHCPPPRFERDYLAGPDVSPGPMPAIAEISSMLATQAILLGMEGEQSSARQLLETCTRIARFGLVDSILMGWMSGATLDISSINAAQAVLSASEEVEGEWRTLAETWHLRQREAAMTLLRAAENEVLYSGMWTFQGALRGSASPFSALGLGTGWAGWVPSVYSSLLLPMLVSDFAEYLKFAARLRDHLSPTQPSHQKVPDSVPPSALLTSALSRHFENIPVISGEYLAKLKLGHIGIKLELYRSSHGKYPDSLADLGLPLAATTDPFSSSPLIYRSTSSGVLLYSVGPNGVDEAGRERSRGQGDLVWKIARPE